MPHRIVFSVTDRQREALEGRAAGRGMSVQQYAKFLVLQALEPDFTPAKLRPAATTPATPEEEDGRARFESWKRAELELHTGNGFDPDLTCPEGHFQRTVWEAYPETGEGVELVVPAVQLHDSDGSYTCWVCAADEETKDRAYGKNPEWDTR